MFPQSPQALRKQLADTLEDAANELPHLAHIAQQRAHLQWLELECPIPWCDERFALHVKADEQAQAAAQLAVFGCAVYSLRPCDLGARIGRIRKEMRSEGNADAM